MKASIGITELRQELLDEIGNHAGLPSLFESVDQVAFFLKNRRFQIVYANRFFYRRLGFTEEEQIVGKEDFELFPKPLAEKFRRDDELVLATGEPMPHLVELFLSRQGLPDWYLTNKVPVMTQEGKPAGVMGTVQRYDHEKTLGATDSPVSQAVEKMLSEPGEIESLHEFAKTFRVSYRHFDRIFKESTGLTPKQFLSRSRIQAACEMLRQSTKPIAEIAIELGYCDQSALTSQFRKRMGFTPLQYRKRFG